MNKKTKKIIITSSLLTALSAVSIATPLILINNKKIKGNDVYEYYQAKNEENIRNNALNNDFYYVFENKRFYTLDDIAEYFIDKYNALKSDYFMGDPYDSITDQENKIIDISKMRKYYKNRISPAYKNALGKHEFDYNTAKQSYINEGLVQYKYDDFNGNVFDTLKEAEDSIARTQSTNEVMYYELENGMKFNPLSKVDLRLLKNEIFNNLFMMYRNPDKVQQSSKLDLAVKIYDRNDVNNKTSYNSIGSDKLGKSDLIKSITQEAVMDYYKIKYDVLTQTKFDVRLNIKEYGDGGETCKYEFASKYGQNIELSSDKKSLLFRNIPYKELGKFSVFTNQKTFLDTADNGINQDFIKMKLYSIKHITNILARELKVDNFFDGGFKVVYKGDDHGWKDGVDIDIMKEGTKKPAHFIAFETEFTNNNYEFMTVIKNNYFNKIADMQRKYGANSLLTKINNYIYNKVFNVVFQDANNTPNRIQMEDYINVRHQPRYRQNPDDFKHKRAKKFKIETTKNPPVTLGDVLSNNFMIDNSALCNFVDRNDNSILLDSIIDNKAQLVKFLTESDYKYVVEYNQKPLFELSNIINTVNVNNIYDFSFAKNIANYFNNESNKSKYEDWKNLSQKFTLGGIVDEKRVKIINQTSNNYFKWNRDYELQFIQTEDNDQPLIYPDAEVPSLPEKQKLAEKEKIDNYKVNSIVHVFKQQLEKIQSGNSEWEMEVKDKFNNPEDILLLYSKDNNRLTPKNLSFREYLNNGLNYNVSLYNNQYLKLFDSKLEKDYFIKNDLKGLQPSKIVVLYDLLGNIVNPGVRLTDQESYQTTSDAIYDSKKTIIDNLLRTKLIPIDQNKVYYQEDNLDNYTIIDKRVNQVYKLSIDGKNVHFVEFNNALNYLKQYLKINSIKVVY